tara:strand:+ start:2843 stop:2989 length:147 start_codon:yes stop_codon:yes gene_type:complete
MDIKNKLIYIDVFWLNLQMLKKFDKNKIEKYVNEKCLTDKQQNKKVLK